MLRRASLFSLAVVLSVALAACGGDDEAPASSAPAGSAEEAGGGGAAKTVTVGGGDALLWGEGDVGVVLSHGGAFDAVSWTPLAEEIAAAGMTVLAVQDIAPDSITAAADYLTAEAGAQRVALIGASAGADATAEALVDGGPSPDQLILISPNAEAKIPGSEPKLFIASEDEAVADVAGQLADSAEGSDNESVLLPGSAHAQAIFDTDQGDRLLMTILDRLEGLAA